MYRSWFGLITLLVSYAVTGYLLSNYEATAAIWLLTEIIVVYLAWTGTGAIFLSIAGGIGIVGIGVLTADLPYGMSGLPFNLNAAQVWAIDLGFSLFWAILVIFQLAFTTHRLKLSGWKSLEVFWIAFMVANLGLVFGNMLNLNHL
ncbi:MAG TPA: hypothetical protein IGS53_14425 [Leptolyngbyaceae cyanobacterium M33_DOE_097]|uniref:Uncharacterized protein n=1 Tax=Oscillatoriales cyanobacterium SpSt-418 TaxID=2282169 RepID=A0A7C3PNP3_9CYAN|nr:hypothetical protein [Leptolyngbyaceae cyanobacterium M33_DOE_097]